VLDVFTIAHICTYRGLENPIFVLGPRLVSWVRFEHKKGPCQTFNELIATYLSWINASCYKILSYLAVH
jgi:hypothetical protein